MRCSGTAYILTENASPHIHSSCVSLLITCSHRKQGRYQGAERDTRFMPHRARITISTTTGALDWSPFALIRTFRLDFLSPIQIIGIQLHLIPHNQTICASNCTFLFSLTRTPNFRSSVPENSVYWLYAWYETSSLRSGLSAKILQ